MEYFVTGASGFIGKRLVRKLLARRGATVHFLVRDASREKLAPLYAFWGVTAKRAIPVVGDISKAGCALKAAERKALQGRIKHFFHLAAIYDLKADAEEQTRVNVEGTRNVVALANDLKVGCFHHVSSIAAAGMFEGMFREDMFEEAENLEHPYFSTKHDSERIARAELKVPWRIYRPALVVGDSRTGEMDKIDGPYYFFKVIQRLRQIVPPWMPTIGIEGGRINIVPVDYVVDAMTHIAHLPSLDGQCFHLIDPQPMRVGDVLGVFARAAHAPPMALRINAALLGFIPRGVKKSLMALTPVRRIRSAVMKDLGFPEDILDFVNYPTRFDCRGTLAALEGSGIECPRLADYAWVLWDYWERHLDPDLFIDRTLKGQVRGKVVLVTGGSSGIGLAVARKIASAGATTIICGRDEEKLREAADLVKADGYELLTFAVDLADMADCDRMVKWIVDEQGGVDILVNNAGRSIRRALDLSYERFHDYERTMALNYFGALKLTLHFLPGMRQRGDGHVVNVSSMGVQTGEPRFTAYVASKSALDAFSRAASGELFGDGVAITTIYMPLVRTPMIAPTRMYNNVPTLSPEEAADMVVDAVVNKHDRIATRLGILGQVMHAVMPGVAQIVMNTAFRMFPDSDASRGAREVGKPPQLSADQIAFQQLMRGVHF